MKRPTLFLIAIFAFMVVVIFRPWFFYGEIIAADWPYFFNETVSEFSLFPPSWGARHGNGLGGMTNVYFLDQYLYFTTSLFTNTLNISWVTTYKIFWFGMFIVLSTLSTTYLLKTIFNKPGLLQILLGVIIYLTNTYVLMVVGGGQMGVALAYAIASLVLARFMKLIGHLSSQSLNSKFLITNYQLPITVGLVLAIQIMFDPRIAYVTMIAIALYIVLRIKYYVLNIFSIFLVPIGIALLLNASWILPLILFKAIPLPSGLASSEGFQFLSFADFSHTLSLLHPNWPENIFGKTYFLQPEFLLLPILAFSSLLFLRGTTQNHAEQNAEPRRTIIFFALLGLLGVFLSKGANPPFGEVNQWLFQYAPGMNLFRDPTKFYLMIALSYSVLIPFSMNAISNYLISNIQIKYKIFDFSYVFLLFTILYLIFLIRPAVLGQLGGTFQKHEFPKEYVELKDFLHNQPEFFRVLWVPSQPRFAFTSNLHPGVEAIALFHATDSASSLQANSAEILSDLSIKYLVVPYDPFGEIFVKDRKYDEKQYAALLAQLETIDWLRERARFGKIIVFEIPKTKDHFWLEDGQALTYEMISTTRYKVDASLIQPTKLIFSENYSPYWRARIGNKTLSPEKTEDNLNVFPIANTGHIQVDLKFDLENYYRTGRFIAGITLLGCTIILFRLRRGG